MVRSVHPTDDMLTDFGLGRLNGPDSSSIEQHLADCETCRDRVDSTADDEFVRRVRETIPRASDPAARLMTRSQYGSIRFLARGGLGEVSLARDEQIGRDVAIKRILPAGAEQPARQRRFLREARITGRLEHPGIVPVYGLGEDESGHPCYAMRFVPGETLQHSIQSLHARGPVEPSALRPLLGRFVSLCATVAYAHSRGVVHRDIKPSNVAIGQYGETILLDWGLAQAEHEAEPDSTIVESVPTSARFHTRTGTILGTPGFMAPEQQAGQRVTPAADVYSLGATLRMILTGSSAVDPAPPVSPPELAAVAAKAMSALPADRYGSALDLAAEIERWLADEPVLAYPDPLMSRVRRFIRRRAIAAASVATLLFIAAVALAIGTVLVNREREKTAVALEEKSKLAIAEAEQRTLARAAEAQMLADFRAGTNDAIEKLIGSKQNLGPLEKAYLQNTMNRWLELANRQGDDPRGKALRAEGHFRVAGLWSRLGDAEAAMREFAAAREAYRIAVEANPDDPLPQRMLAGSHTNLGTMYRDRGQLDKALAEFTEAMRRQEIMIAADPQSAQYRRDLTMTLMNAGNLYQILGQRLESIRVTQKACDTARKALELEPGHVETRQLLAGAHNNLASVLLELGKNEDAKATIEIARDLRVQLAAQNPGDLNIQHELSQTHIALGILNRNLNRRDLARKELEAAGTILTRLTTAYPSILELKQTLAVNHRNLGTVLRELKDFDAAATSLSQAITVLTALTTAQTDNTELRRELALCHNDFGILHHDRKRELEALTEYESAIRLFDELIRKNPKESENQISLSGVYCNRGNAHRSLKQYDDALADYDKTISTLKPLLATLSEETLGREFLKNAYVGKAACGEHTNRPQLAADNWKLALSTVPESERTSLRIRRANTQRAAGRMEMALQDLTALEKEQPRDPETWIDMARFFAQAGESDPAKREEYQRRAVTLLNEAVKRGHQNVDELTSDDELKPLHERGDFKRLIHALRQNSTTSKP